VNVVAATGVNTRLSGKLAVRIWPTVVPSARTVPFSLIVIRDAVGGMAMAPDVPEPGAVLVPQFPARSQFKHAVAGVERGRLGH